MVAIAWSLFICLVAALLGVHTLNALCFMAVRVYRRLVRRVEMRNVYFLVFRNTRESEWYMLMNESYKGPELSPLLGDRPNAQDYEEITSQLAHRWYAFNLLAAREKLAQVKDRFPKSGEAMIYRISLSGPLPVTSLPLLLDYPVRELEY